MFWSLSSSFPRWLLLNSLSTFLLLSIVIRGPIQFKWFILTNGSIFTSLSICINYYICLICIYFNPTQILLKTFPPKLARRSAKFLFNTQDYVPYFVTGLINVLWLLLFPLSRGCLFSTAICIVCICNFYYNIWF